MQHNRWLHWKIKHGLARRGRVGGISHPKGLIAGILYKLFYRKKEQAGALTTSQAVGGVLASSGSVNEG